MEQIEDIQETRYDDSNHEFKAISTKVSLQAAAMIDALCKKNGITTYDLLQQVCDCIIRYMSDKHRLSNELQRLMEMFFEDLRNSTFRISDYCAKPGIQDCIFILGDKTHKGQRSVLVKEPFFGMAEEDWNIQHQIEVLLCAAFPLLYRRIRRVGAEMGSDSVLDILISLVEQASNSDDEDAREIRAMFSDNRRGDFGQEDLQDAPYVRHINRNSNG